MITAAVSRDGLAFAVHARRRRHKLRPGEHHCAALLPVVASTTTVPVMYGCSEQKYSVYAGRGEREREAVLRVERLRLEQLARRGDRVRRVVRIEPGHRGAGLYCNALGRKSEVVDLHLAVGSVRRDHGKADRGSNKDAGRKRDGKASDELHLSSHDTAAFLRFSEV